MLFLLFGSSAAGKTTTLDRLRGRVPDLALHDFDEIGVPPNADTAWRHRANEAWVRRVLDYDASGTDVLLAGQTPFGELLATPSATSLEAMSGCLLDCDDPTLMSRLRTQARESFKAGRVESILAWAEWMRGHARDPRFRQEVIHHPNTESEMCWGRWSSWAKNDPRWRVLVVDASTLTVDAGAHRILDWVTEERAVLSSGSHPLRRGRIPE